MGKVFFLIYNSRSGSTLLSKLLDEHEDIGVTVESLFMINLIRLKRWFEKSGDVEKLFHRLEKLDRFYNLQINFNDFIAYFDGRKKISSVAEGIIKTYFTREKHQSTVWVVKDGVCGLYINQISAEMPHAKFIHIVRDGRAVLNSMIKSIDPYSKKPMSSDTINHARMWKDMIVRVDLFKEKHPELVLEIQYENLISNTKEEIKRVRWYLGLEEKINTKNIVSLSYYDKIPQREKSIHSLAKDGTNPSRINAWEEELPIQDRKLFEYFTSNILAKKGYKVESRASLYDMVKQFCLIKSLILSYIRRVKSKWQKIF
ncbi:MAG TPA: sulfotransferase family protein [Candidatus Wunengus sp. YC60]|uniref:sulfotransferase family protein n=1 Tax=Candidatus Wunengus sp. YC60 TaxID=3367697 RepID=UPI004027843A